MAERSTFGTFTEKSGLLGASGSKKRYPTPLSFWWRLTHFLCYINGGVTFFFGSLLLYTSLSAPVTSSVLYTFGSVTFLIADTMEWLTNNHVGCFWYADYEDSYEAAIQDMMDGRETSSGKWQRAEVGVNFFVSAIGSFFYLVGSSLFLPDISLPVQGLYCFIVASVHIIIAQVWKLYRAGLAPEQGTTSASLLSVKQRPKLIFSVTNYSADLPGFFVDFFVIFGAAGYLIGSPIFLPTYDVNSTINDAAATVFTLGGFFYVLSGIAMAYRYFCTLNYPHE